MQSPPKNEGGNFENAREVFGPVKNDKMCCALNCPHDHGSLDNDKAAEKAAEPNLDCVRSSRNSYIRVRLDESFRMRYRTQPNDEVRNSPIWS